MTMGNFDGAEVYEMVRKYLLSKFMETLDKRDLVFSGAAIAEVKIK